MEDVTIAALKQRMDTIIASIDTGNDVKHNPQFSMFTLPMDVKQINTLDLRSDFELRKMILHSLFRTLDFSLKEYIKICGEEYPVYTRWNEELRKRVYQEQLKAGLVPCAYCGHLIHPSHNYCMHCGKSTK